MVPMLVIHESIPVRGQYLSDLSLGKRDQRGNATYNLTQHILAGTRGLVPCGRLCFRGDYFAGQRDQILVESSNDALAILSGAGRSSTTARRSASAPPTSRAGAGARTRTSTGTTSTRWRGAKTHFGRSRSQERSTYMQLLELGAPIRGVNVLPPGQSGFLSKLGLSLRRSDPSVRAFSYKPMRL
jgi:hypothetical protein